MMRPEDRAREMLAESGIPEAGSTRLLESLTELGRAVDEVEPLPGPELTSLIAGTSRGAASRRRRARVMVATAVALGTVGAGGLAAAANELPDGAQDLVAEFSERYLPFDLPGAGTPGTDPDARFAPAPKTPPSSLEAERAGVPALSPADEAPEARGADGRASDEAASQRASEPSRRSPSRDDPEKTRPSPAPAPADDAPFAGEEDAQGGAAGPEAGEEPVTKPSGGDAGVAEEPPPPPPEAPVAGAETGPDAPPGKAAERSKGGDRRGPGVRGKPNAAPADGSDG